jgi:hypothetical protein
VLVVAGAALAVKLAAPVLAAAAELLNIVLIAAAVILGLGAAGLVALLARRWRRTLAGAARTTPLRIPIVARAARPLPEPEPAIERPAEVHLHLYGISAADIATILRQQQLPGLPSEPRE